MASQSIDVSNTASLIERADQVAGTVREYYEDTTEWHVAKKTKEAVINYQPSKSTEFPHGRLYRGRMDFKCPKETLYEYLSPVLNEGVLRQKWDKDISSLKVLKQVDQDTFIVRSCTNSAAKGLISPRDFIDLLKIVKSDESISINAQSILSDAFPHEAKFVRGWNHPCGVVCKMHPENPNYTQLTTFVQADIKGMLPKSLVESALPGSMAGLFVSLKNILEKDKKLVD